MGPSLPDQAAHGAVCMHDLKGRDPPAPLILHQLLGYHRPQHHGKLYPYLRLLLAGKGVNDAVDGIGRSVGVQRGDHRVSGFRSGHGSTDGFRIPHFSQQNHIRRLTKAGTQGREEVHRVHSDLPLADDAALIAVQKLNGIFQRDDVAVPAFVDPVNDAGLGGGFSAARRSRDQHQSAFHIRQFHHLRRDMQRLPVWNIKGDDTDHRCKRSSLPISIYAKPGKARHGKGKIIVSRAEIPAHGALGHFINLRDEPLRIRRKQSSLLQRTKASIQLFADRAAGHKEQVGCLIGHRALQILHDSAHGSPSSSLGSPFHTRRVSSASQSTEDSACQRKTV